MKALEGVKILDMTHVQSGPTCTQLLAWFGADVIKVERPGAGDATRGQLRDIDGADSLYFTMLNHNKRSITLNPKSPQGNKIFEQLIRTCDVMVENFAPGAIDRMGFPWEKIQEINPRMIYASIKGFGPGPYEECKVYENVAQCAGGSASTTGFLDGLRHGVGVCPYQSAATQLDAAEVAGDHSHHVAEPVAVQDVQHGDPGGAGGFAVVRGAGDAAVGAQHERSAVVTGVEVSFAPLRDHLAGVVLRGHAPQPGQEP